MDPIKTTIYAIAFLALVSSLSSSPAEHQAPRLSDGKKNLLLKSSPSSADESQHDRAAPDTSIIGFPNEDTEKTTLTVEDLNKVLAQVFSGNTAADRAAPETSKISFLEDTETTTTSNRYLNNVLSQVFSGNNNAVTATGRQGKNANRSLVYEDLNFVALDLDGFDDTGSTGDTSNREGVLEPETSSDSDSIFLTYPASMIDVVPNITILSRIPNLSSTTTEDPDASDENGDTIPPNEDSMNNCTTVTLDKKNKRVADIKCQENMWNIYNRLVCPFLSDDIAGVYGGSFATEGDFPHAGAVGWQKKPPEDNSHVFMCGSSLISSKYALTAAHCRVINQTEQFTLNLVSRNPDVVAFGSVKISEDNESKLLKAVIDRFITYKDYKPPIKYNDIALIKFKSHVPLKNNIRPACIWIGDVYKEHEKGNIIGWGKTEADTASPKLKTAMLPFINHRECNTLLIPHKMRHWDDGILDSQFCAADLKGGIDTCAGDSGGPIQVIKPLPNDQDTMVAHVVGVTSFGPGKFCAEQGKAGVYTNVTSYLCWIEKEVWPEEDNEFC